MNFAGKTYKIDIKDIRLTMLYKTINEIANVQKKEILILAVT